MTLEWLKHLAFWGSRSKLCSNYGACGEGSRFHISGERSRQRLDRLPG
jgi:hypothetical protein